MLFESCPSCGSCSSWGCAVSWATGQAPRPALAGSIRPQLARSGCPWRPCWVHLASNGSICGLLALLLGRFGCFVRSWASHWLDLAAQRVPIDTISQKKIDLLIDDHASMLPASCSLTRFFMPQTCFIIFYETPLVEQTNHHLGLLNIP